MAGKTLKIEAKFLGNHNGGFAIPILENGELSKTKYPISLRETLGAVNGDTVQISASPDGMKVSVIAIKKRAISSLIGTIHHHNRVKNKDGSPLLYVTPSDNKLSFSVYIDANNNVISAKEGDVVLVRIVEYPNEEYIDAVGVIEANFGDSCSRQANYSAILADKGVATEFSPEAIEIAASHEHDTLSAEGRLDLRDKLIFTIDSADAKDLDDAISVEKTPLGYLLGVHIADVSHYVKEDTALDRDAFERGTSIYFADKVVPMLPFSLSNGICSLNGGVDRYALSAHISLSMNGDILGVDLSKSIINSSVRGVYSEINSLIDGTADEAIKEKYACILGEPLKDILKLYNILNNKSIKRGALDLDSPESKIILDQDNNPIDIVLRERGVSELIIEQFMLCANEAVATWLTKRSLPCVYRVHDEPDEDRLASFVLFAHNLNLSPEFLRKGASVPTNYLQKILNKAKKNGVGRQISYILLRTMKKAIYSEKLKAHYGLGTDCYCHFTSPIRRYPDLSVHRIITAVLAGEDAKKYAKFAKISAEKSTEQEQKALEAERAIDDLYKTTYMAMHVGEIFEATISSVTSFGMFCELANTCEGLIPLRTMANFYTYDEQNMTLSSPEATFRLGDSVKIKVVSANVATQKVEFSLVDEPKVVISTKKKSPEIFLPKTVSNKRGNTKFGGKNGKHSGKNKGGKKR